MLRITRIDEEPFHTVAYRTSGPSGKPVRQRLPFYRAYATGLPDTIQALGFASDLQGREQGGENRLMGEAVAEALAGLVQSSVIPQPEAVLLCGDLYDYPDCHKRGGTGPVDEVFRAFARMAPQVIGVLGNHDELTEPKSLPRNAQVLDGGTKTVGKLVVGGVSGIVGDPGRHQRRTEHSYLSVMERVTSGRPDLLLLHQGPDDPERNRRGDPGVALSLATGYRGLTVFGHSHWSRPWLIPVGDGQALNVDGRVVVLMRGDEV